jgi:hypothetical protein
MRVLDTEPGADRGAEWHDGGAPSVLEAAGEHGVVVRVGKHDETLRHQLLSRLQQLDGVWQERNLVPDDLELHPVRLERVSRQLRRERCLRGRKATSGVGENAHAEAGQHVEE